MIVESSPSAYDQPNFIRSFWEGLKRNWLVYVLFVVMVMSVAGFLVAIGGINKTNAQNAQLKRLVECQNSYNEINNERTRQLAEATDRERIAEEAADTALSNAVKTVYGAASIEAQKNAFKVLNLRLDEQRIARKMSDQERREHPVPPPPKALCGGTPA